MQCPSFGFLQQYGELFYTFLFVILCWRYKDMGILKYFSVYLREMFLNAYLEICNGFIIKI